MSEPISKFSKSDSAERLDQNSGTQSPDSLESGSNSPNASEEDKFDPAVTHADASPLSKPTLPHIALSLAAVIEEHEQDLAEGISTSPRPKSGELTPLG